MAIGKLGIAPTAQRRRCGTEGPAQQPAAARSSSQHGPPPPLRLGAAAWRGRAGSGGVWPGRGGARVGQDQVGVRRGQAGHLLCSPRRRFPGRGPRYVRLVHRGGVGGGECSRRVENASPRFLHRLFNVTGKGPWIQLHPDSTKGSEPVWLLAQPGRSRNLLGPAAELDLPRPVKVGAREAGASDNS